MTKTSRILIPLGTTEKGLKSIHYALALAERLAAEIYIIHLPHGAVPKDASASSVEEAFSEIINSARLAGVKVSEHLADHDAALEVVDLIRKESIDVLVFSADDTQCARLLQRIEGSISLQIIQVSEKEHVFPV